MNDNDNNNQANAVPTEEQRREWNTWARQLNFHDFWDLIGELQPSCLEAIRRLESRQMLSQETLPETERRPSEREMENGPAI